MAARVIYSMSRSQGLGDTAEQASYEKEFTHVSFGIPEESCHSSGIGGEVGDWACGK